MASINISNFSATIVSFDETTGVDWTLDNPSVALLLTPNTGFTINASNFSATAPLPTNVSSVVFSQSGANITCLVTYISPSVMPANDVLIDICATGYAEQTQVTLSGTLKACGTSNVSLPASGDLPSAYAVNGDFNTTATVLTQSVVASTGFFFEVEPVLALNIGIVSNYTITSVKTYNAANQLTQVVFTVVYKFPQTSVSGDEICLTANATVIYSPSVKIQSYSINSTDVLTSGETRVITISGITGAAWALQVTESVGGTTIGQFSGTIDSTGFDAESVIFPASLVNVIYTFTLTGDLASSFCTTSPYIPCVAGQPSVWQLYQYTSQNVSFVLTSTSSSITTGSANTKAFTPFTIPGIRSYSVSASRPGSSQDFIFTTTPINTDWSNQGLGDPITNQTVQDPLLITINNASDPKTLVIGLDTDIGTVGTQALLSELNLDNFLQSVTTPTIITTTVTNITGTTATSGGGTITDGGGTISDKGIQWSAVANFATILGATTQGGGTAGFASSITGLTAGSTYYVRAFVRNEGGLGYGAVLTFAANVSVPCNSSVSSGGTGITDLSVSLDSAGGLISFALNAYGVGDKLEIIHGTASGTKKATTGWFAGGNFGTPAFDNVYGTEPSNTIPTAAQANANAYFIGTQAVNPAPLRTTEFYNDTGYTATLGSYQQIVWWPYTAADYQTNSQVTVRVTGASGTQWLLLRICCPDSSCT